MGKKSKKHLKLEPEWIELVINLSIGTDLAIMTQRQPEVAHAVFRKCNEMIEKEYKKTVKFEEQVFTHAACNICIEVLSFNITSLLVHFLENGMPKTSPIVLCDSTGRPS
jgi:hypothetical protein